MSWTFSITLKPSHYPDKISWGFTWISEVKSEARPNTTLVRIVPKTRPNGSVVKTLVAWKEAFINKLGSWERVRDSQHFFKSVYTPYDVTAYVYLQYMHISRQSVHLLEVLIPRLMQDNIIMLRFRLWHNTKLKEQTELQAKNSNHMELENHSTLQWIVNKITVLGIIFTLMWIWGQFITTEFVWFSETTLNMEKYSHLERAATTRLLWLYFVRLPIWLSFELHLSIYFQFQQLDKWCVMWKGVCSSTTLSLIAMDHGRLSAHCFAFRSATLLFGWLHSAAVFSEKGLRNTTCSESQSRHTKSPNSQWTYGSI